MNRFASLRSVTLAAALCGATALAQAAEPAAPAAAPAQPAAPAQSAAPAQPAAQQQLEQQLESARQRLEIAAREVGELSEQLGREAGGRVVARFGGPPRAMLGLQVERGAGGAHVVAVSPGGPAEVAGIRTGDVITAVGGVDLATSPNPGIALVERMRELEPGQKVKVSAQRAGKTVAFDVTPREGPAMAMRGIAAMPGMAGVRAPFGPDFGPGGPQRIELRQFDRDSENFRGMEFATLSDRLGSYFGVKSGVLVVRAGEGSTFKLQDGDVIVSIDGRAPSNAAHATRILRSYQPGEKLTLRVQRDRKAQNIEVSLPDRGAGRPERD